MRTSQVSFDRLKLQCSDLVEKVDDCEKKLVEIEMEYHYVVEKEEQLKNERNDIDEKP